MRAKKVAKESQPDAVAQFTTTNSVVAQLQARAQEAREAALKLPLIQQLGLPLFDDMRLNVGPLMRGSLFNALPDSIPRQSKINAMVEMTGEIVASYTGLDLRQDEAVVLGELLHLQKTKRLGDVVPFKPSDLLDLLGWSRSSHNYARLLRSLQVLKATAVTMMVPVRDVTKPNGATLADIKASSILASFTGQYSKGQPAGVWTVTIESAIANIITKQTATLIEHAMRKQIGRTRSTLSLWLHNYISEFAIPFPWEVEFLWHQSGYTEHLSLPHFKQALTRACNILVREGFLLSFRFDERKRLVVVRAPRKQDKDDDEDDAGGNGLKRKPKRKALAKSYEGAEVANGSKTGR
jgi:hypothetical protein